MQIYLRLNVARLLACIQKQFGELDAEVDVVRAAGPLPPVGHLLLKLPLRHDLIGAEAVDAVETFVDDERTLDDRVEEFLLLLFEAFAKRLGESFSVRIGIATARYQPALTARSRYTLNDTRR